MDTGVVDDIDRRHLDIDQLDSRRLLYTLHAVDSATDDDQTAMIRTDSSPRHDMMLHQKHIPCTRDEHWATSSRVVLLENKHSTSLSAISPRPATTTISSSTVVLLLLPLHDTTTTEKKEDKNDKNNKNEKKKCWKNTKNKKKYKNNKKNETRHKKNNKSSGILGQR